MSTEISHTGSKHNSALAGIPVVGPTLAKIHNQAGMIRPTVDDSTGVRLIKRSAQVTVVVATGLAGGFLVIPE